MNGVDLPPSPPSLPIIGHLHYLLLSFLHHKSFLHYKSFHTLSSKYGPLLHLQFFFFPAILVSSAPVAYQIFMTHDVNISSRNLFSDASGFFTAPYGEHFKFMKKLIVTNMFGPQALEHSRSIRADELERSYMNLVNKAKKKESVDIKKEAMELIGNIICRMSFGRRFTEEIGEADSVQGSVIKSSGTKKKMILEILFFFEILLFRQVEKLGISLFKKDITAVLKKLNELLEKIMLEHKEKPNMNGYNDMMDLLLSVYEDENADYKITKNHIKAFFVELIFGGIDTNVITIQWTMAEIVNNPIIMERLREEIDSVVGKSRLIQETDLPNLPYLQAVIKEG
ncbi:unnamed protein product [Microthlaspi erraticum]|uniref:Uncharacterized protein n=1 Tax=Microthlaspi erraticum TaxID=1685480 RepID=A0A6D2JEA4_9BRAS|nr:unnamed protein product [Microthlaspi erraticum]